jgi:hypothetical protein
LTEHHAKATFQDEILDTTYVRQDMFHERMHRLDDRCQIHEKNLAVLEKNQASMERKVTATLVSVICTLVAVLTAVGLNIFH